jgi:cyclopropane-fatty-acyl-phospholipid synthase
MADTRRIDTPDERATAGRHDQKSLEGRLLRRLLTRFGDPPIEFELAWTGEHIGPSTIPATERVRISDRHTLRGLLRDTQIRFGDAYSTGRIEVQGDLIRLITSVYRGLQPGQ